MDLAKDEATRSLLEVAFSSFAMGRPFAAPPGVPAERVQALRDAFTKTLSDPAFLADAARSDTEISLMTGNDVQALVERIFQTSDADVRRLANIMQ